MEQKDRLHGGSPGKREPEPIAQYALISGAFIALTSISYLALRKYRKSIPKLEATDLVLLGLATNRLSRLITRDKVARPVRAPFTEMDHEAPPGAPKERARGSGFTKVIGELVTCPRCAGVWGSAALSLAYAWSPPLGRFVSVLLSSATISDFVNRRYTVLQEHAQELSEQSVQRESGRALGAGLAPPV